MVPRRKHRLLTLAVAGLIVTQATAQGQEAQTKEHPLHPAIRLAQEALERIEALPGYEATFYKKEVVGTSTVAHQMRIKIRHKPFSVYLLFEKPHAGREVIYVDGQNNGKLIAHESGFLSIAGALELSPTDTMAMSENRYPITKAGIANTVKIMIQQWEAETKYGETEVKYYKDAKLGTGGKILCRVIESSHPQPRRQFNYHMVRLWIASESGLPVRMQKFGFPKRQGADAPILEDYTFLDLKTDIRLTDADFDRNNSKYSF